MSLVHNRNFQKKLCHIKQSNFIYEYSSILLTIAYQMSAFIFAVGLMLTAMLAHHFASVMLSPLIAACSCITYYYLKLIVQKITVIIACSLITVFRCRECSRTLLPGSYKFTEDPGALVCTHHFTRSASTNQNGHSDMSNRLAKFTTTSIEEPRCGNDSEISPQRDEEKPSELEERLRKQRDSKSKVETEDGAASGPPNPFDESEEEDRDIQQEDHKPAADVTYGDAPSTSVKSTAAEGRPVPAPRRVLEPSPAFRPIPRLRRSRVSKSIIVNGEQ